MLQKMTPPKPHVDRYVTHIFRERPYFVWHPSGPDYAGKIAGYQFVGGRIQGAVPGQVAQVLKAYRCRVEDYLPGMDILDWNPVETGGFEPRFTTDKLVTQEQADEAFRILHEQEHKGVGIEPPAPPEVAEVVISPEDMGKLIDATGATKEELLAIAVKLSTPSPISPEQFEEFLTASDNPPEPEAKPEPQDYSLLSKDAVKALCDKRGLKVDRRSVVKMLEALEASD